MEKDKFFVKKMGRNKNRFTSKFGPWGCILATDPQTGAIKSFPLDNKGKLKVPFKERKHDRTNDHKFYLPAISSDGGFDSSHFSSPQQQLNRKEEVQQTSIASNSLIVGEHASSLNSLESLNINMQDNDNTLEFSDDFFDEFFNSIPDNSDLYFPEFN